MEEYSEFHDGWFEGLWIDGKTIHVFLATEGREQFVFFADGVAELSVDGVKSGNIIFEVLTRGPEEVLHRDIQALYELQTGQAGETQAANLMEKVHLHGWKVLEINPSYGARCLIVTNSLELFSRENWLKRHLQIDLTA
jgi:hypothetical protein